MANPQVHTNGDGASDLKLHTKIPDEDEYQEKEEKEEFGLETAEEKRQTEKIKTKIDSKRKGAGVSLSVLKNKAQKSKIIPSLDGPFDIVADDKESEELIAEINPWEDPNAQEKSPEKRQRVFYGASEMFGVITSTLTAAMSQGIDVSTADKLINATHQADFPLVLNGVEVTGIAKLAEIYAARGSPWHRAFEGNFWETLYGRVSKNHQKNKTKKGNSRIVEPTTAASPTLALQAQPAEKLEQQGTLSKLLSSAQEHPVIAAFIVCAALAGSVGLYKVIKGFCPSDTTGNKKSGGGGLMKWLVAGGLGTALTIFGVSRALGSTESVDSVFKAKGINVPKSVSKEFINLILAGKIKEAFSLVYNGIDEKKEYHDRVASVINADMHQEPIMSKAAEESEDTSTDGVLGTHIYALKDKNYAEFMDSSAWDNVDAIHDANEWIRDLIHDIPLLGSVAGLVMDSKHERNAVLLVKAYLKKNEATIKNRIAIRNETTTVGDVLGALIPKDQPPADSMPTPDGIPTVATMPAPGGIPTAATTPAPGGIPGTAKIPEHTITPGAVVKAAVGGAAIVGATGVLPSSLSMGTASAAVESMKPKEPIPVDSGIHLLTDGEVANSADNYDRRKELIDLTPPDSKLRKNLVDKENVLGGHVKMKDIQEALQDINNRRIALVRSLTKIESQEEADAVHAKIVEIDDYIAGLNEYLKAHTIAAGRYLLALQTNNQDTIDEAFANFINIKEGIAEIFDDLFEREGWSFLATTMISQGIPYSWNFYKHYLCVGDFHEANARYLFGKYWDKVKSAARISKIKNVFKQPPLMTLEDIELKRTTLHNDIEGFESGLRNKGQGYAPEEINKEFFDHYDALDKRGSELQSQLSRHLDEQDKLLTAAIKRGDANAAKQIASVMNRISETRAHLEAGIMKDAVNGWNILHGSFGQPIHYEGAIPLKTVGRSLFVSEGYDAGINKLRHIMRRAILAHHKEHGGNLKRLIPTKGKLGFFAAQLGVGGWVGSDDHTSFVEAATNTAIMATPVVGFLLDFKQAATGKEVFTGRQIDGWDRLISLGFGFAGAASDALAIFGFGLVGKSIITGLKASKGLSAARKAQKIIAASKDAYAAAKVSRGYKAAESISKVGKYATIGAVGTAAITMGFNPITEVLIPEGFEKEILDPLSHHFNSAKDSLDTKVEHMRGAI